MKMEDIREVHILLMDNLFLHVKNKISEFDLKGSIINREVHEPFVIEKNCLKDVNLQKISKNDKFLRFQRGDMRTICEQILKDIKFMADHKLMDYSLLLLTEKNPDFVEPDISKSSEVGNSSMSHIDRMNSLGDALNTNNITALKR